ncbi:MAG TPA: ATP-binding protein, partial [Verrucomicrobiae bacterium]|nr:ATP-binding protein [Verrucomicrobiae bacterium]
VQKIARRDLIQKTLEESEAQFHFLFTENPQPMWIFDLRTGRFLTVNKAALGQYGFTAEEFMGLTINDLSPAGGATEFPGTIAKGCPGPEPLGIRQHLRKDGTLMDVEITALDLAYGDTEARLILATDISERRRRESENLKAQKMELIGQMSGGVAHHFNNMLTVVSGHTSVLRENPQDPKSTEHLEPISKAVNQAAGFTRLLLMAGGRHSLQSEPMDLNRQISSLTPMLQRVVSERITLVNKCGSYPLPALADPHLLEHIVLHLILNARDAIPGKGTIIISSAIIRADKAYVQANSQACKGSFVCLTIADTGCGMNPEVEAHLFEPFFTTRASRNAMGLGLASVYGAVKQMSGWVDYDTKAGSGTEFRVFLPCAPEDTSTRTQTEFQRARPKVRGTVLLVEPDDRMRASARCILNWNGIRVVEADGSSTALILWDGQASDIDLLLTEISLPDKLSGPDLAKQLQQAKPGLKVIYTSDYDPAREGENPVLPADLKYIPKPYSQDKLLQMVQGTLSQTA